LDLSFFEKLGQYFRVTFETSCANISICLSSMQPKGIGIFRLRTNNGTVLLPATHKNRSASFSRFTILFCATFAVVQQRFACTQYTITMGQ